MNYQDERLVNNSYYKGRKDLITIMQGYRDFEKFAEQEKYTDENNENGAVLVITEKQYILALNGGMGQGGHFPALAQIKAMLKNENLNYDNRTMIMNQSQLRDKYCWGRIMAEQGDRTLGINLPSGRQTISPAEYASFMAFYEEYAYTINAYNFKVAFGHNTMTIDDLQRILEQMIDYNMAPISPDDEVIIGTPTPTDGRGR